MGGYPAIKFDRIEPLDPLNRDVTVQVSDHDTLKAPTDKMGTSFKTLQGFEVYIWRKKGLHHPVINFRLKL